MAVPTRPTYSLEVITASTTALLDAIDESASAGSIKIRDSGDVLLGEVTLTYPAGTVDELTGTLTITVAAQEDAALASGTIAYAEVCNAADYVHLAIPAIQSSEAVSGYIAFATLTVAENDPLAVTGVTIG